mmetsp:Transcript_8562/g.13215  ORF Transcript_8562/g.13215 Transcript_8562/m.13215 type:complete len:148 (+) Transcript_8562:467-910(+)
MSPTRRGSGRPGDYANFYQRVKEVASDRKWSEKKMNDMLKDPKAFEKEYLAFSRQKRRFDMGKPASVTDSTADRLYNHALDLKSKRIRAAQEKEYEEVETAYLMSNMPKSIPIPTKVASSTQQTSFTSRKSDVRSLNQFIDDQIRYE